MFSPLYVVIYNTYHPPPIPFKPHLTPTGSRGRWGIRGGRQQDWSLESTISERGIGRDREIRKGQELLCLRWNVKQIQGIRWKIRIFSSPGCSFLLVISWTFICHLSLGDTTLDGFCWGFSTWCWRSAGRVCWGYLTCWDCCVSEMEGSRQPYSSADMTTLPDYTSARISGGWALHAYGGYVNIYVSWRSLLVTQLCSTFDHLIVKVYPICHNISKDRFKIVMEEISEKKDF